MMDAAPRSGLARWLASPDPVPGPADLAAQWRDQEAVFVLAPLARADASLGAHLRRSFLGALGPGASPAARARQPCPWDPPCALDVFLREQLRAGAEGLPKPYVLSWQQEGPALAVTLRVFGTACDWFPAAAEAMADALQSRLPWHHAIPGQRGRPQLIDRRLYPPAPPPALLSGPLTLRLLAPMDDGGTQPGRDPAAALLSRAIRRVDAVARWQGLALDPERTPALTAAAHAVQARATRLEAGIYLSENAKGEPRRIPVLTGEIDLPPLPPGLAQVLALATRTHLGRHTNEGLGPFTLLPPG